MEGGNHGEGIGEGGESGAVTPFHPRTFLISNKFKNRPRNLPFMNISRQLSRLKDKSESTQVRKPYHKLFVILRVDSSHESVQGQH